VDRDFLLAFGQRVRELRRELGISQEELAERSGLHRTYVGGIERGERNVSLVNLVRLARGLGMSASTLLQFDWQSPRANST
jgi:transcriptional regulator with XRE-family HTH domain